MNPVLFFGVLTALYAIAFFFDRIFRSCMHYPYDAFLKNSGLKIDFLRVRWHTTAFNRVFLRLGSNSSGSRFRSCLSKSFTLGVVIAFSLLPLGTILLFVAIFNGGSSGPGQSGSDRKGTTTETLSDIKVEILLPGVNLPLEEVIYYTATLLCSTIVHEFGHALAAMLEDVPVTGFGLRIYFCLPLAYTEISQEHLNALKWFKKLRILCAGIWHNFLLGSICYLLLSTLGFLTTPLYFRNSGVIVTEVSSKSPLRAKGDKGMTEGNIIMQINDCHVHNINTWYQCLAKMLRQVPSYCVSSDFIRINDESIEISHHGPDGVLRCCDEKNEKLCCFEHLQDLSNDEPAEIPQHVCLNVRHTVENSIDYCVANNCDNDGYCLKPLLNNATTIMAFKRTTIEQYNAGGTTTTTALSMTKALNDKNLADIIYMGHPLDILQTVHVSEFIPKQIYLNSFWADAYELFLKYNVVFNFGLALINAIPCYGFDGHHIINTVINSFLVNRITERAKRDVVALIVSGIGTLFFAMAVLKVLWSSLMRHVY